MPSRGDRAAPQFDPKQPRGLRRYFVDLEVQFGKAAVTDIPTQKRYACSYVDVDTSELWESIPEYADVTQSFDDFKTAIGVLYPGSQDERKWSVADMDKLVGERSRLGVITIADLGDYYRQFLAITSFLRRKNRLSEAEQGRAFARGFQPELWSRISQRLQLTIPDRFPDDPYTLVEIHKAAQYALHGTASHPRPEPPVASPSTTLPAATTQIKNEDLSAMFERMTETFIKALAMQHNHQPSTNERGARSNGNSSASFICNFCGLPDHMMRNCPLCEEYITAGKCKRSVEGKIVLPSGAFIPRDIIGRYMKERLDEWHRRNPGQLAEATMMLDVMANGISPSPIIASRSTHPGIYVSRCDTPRCNTPKRLTSADRIEALERELFQLRTRGGDRRSKNREKEHAKDVERETEEREERRREVTPPPKKTRLVPEVVIPIVPKPSKPADYDTSESKDNGDDSASPEHPFAAAPDATYSVPTQRNFAAPPKPAPQKKAQPAYRNIAPIYSDKVALEAFDKIMTSMITLTHKEVFSLSPELRTLIAEAIAPRRRPANEIQPTADKEKKDLHAVATSEAIADAIDDLEPDDWEFRDDTLPNEIFAFQSLPMPPPDATVVPDIYDLYLKSLPYGQKPEPLIVAKESLALRSIFPIINNQCEIEAILDPGSQIIAMSEDMCLDLALPYDPSVILTMQSANGEIDKSLGLARNIPLCIGGITLYVQIHVIRSPAYDILLGRPFDTLTESVIRNYANEDQTITIMDPNSGQRATIPTTPRGRPKRITQRRSFIASRI